MHETAIIDMPEAALLDKRLQGDLRSDHAGETGAVYIYRGILALSRDPLVREFAAEHLDTEQQHLAFFEGWLPKSLHSRLLPLWRLSGWLLGAVSTLGGRRGVFLTIAAVETFVVQHYQDQIDYLRDQQEHREIRAVLRRFQRDEDHHRADAAGRDADYRPGLLGRGWARIVGEGSRLAVVAARRL
ncbi:MAG: demethoxyubiquinone hydroxylase family protein [Halieaceae bacterium]|jgi:ubiquinone biosynthesis monooxygenase Coq7|nr:demethoxyubiquinone hydroxylase family protein [Halieaceae bacterium]